MNKPAPAKVLMEHPNNPGSPRPAGAAKHHAVRETTKPLPLHRV